MTKREAEEIPRRTPAQARLRALDSQNTFSATGGPISFDLTTKRANAVTR